MHPDLEMFKYDPASPKHLRLHQSGRKLLAMLGGNRAGKTYWGAQEVVWTIYGIHPYREPYPPPVNIRICCVDEQHGIKEIMLPMFRHLLPEGTYQYKYEPKTLDVATGDGHVAHIKFLTYEMDLDKFGGTSQHLVWMDEEPKQKAQYVQNLMRTADCGGRLLMTMTPLFGMTWAYNVICQGNPGFVDYEHISIYDNKYLSRKEIEEVEANVDPEDADAVIHGRFISPTGLVYKTFRTDKHVMDPLEKLDHEWMIVLGIDTHESMRNPHAVVFVAITKDNEFIVFDEIQERCLLPELAEKIKEKLDKWALGPDGYRFAIMDISQKSATTGINHQAELRKHGIKKIEVADKRPGTPQEGRSKIRNLLCWDEEKGILPALFWTENCQQSIWQMRHYIHDDWKGRTRDQRDPKEEVRKKDDHLLDALRYIVHKDIRWRPKNFSLPQPEPGGKHLIRGVNYGERKPPGAQLR